MGRRDPEALLEERSATIRSQQGELVTLRRQLAEAQAAAVAADERRREAERLVRWLLRDQDVPDMRLTIVPGSALDRTMSNRLYEIMLVEDLDARPQPLSIDKESAVVSGYLHIGTVNLANGQD